MPSVRRPALAAALSGIVAVLAAGCTAFQPPTTSIPYNASDGVRVTVDDEVRADNLLVLAAAQGAPGTLLGALTNAGQDDSRVSLTSDGMLVGTVRVPAGGTVLLGPGKDAEVSLGETTAPPGAVLPLQLATRAGGTAAVSVPVLDGSLPEYAPLVPTPAPAPTGR